MTTNGPAGVVVCVVTVGLALVSCVLAPAQTVDARVTPDDMAWVPAGRAVLGSAHHYPEERPVVEVDVAGFWIDRHEVTNARFAAFVEATGYRTTAERPRADFPEPGSAVFVAPADGGSGWRYVAGANWRHPEGPGSSIVGREDHPVVHVSFADAGAFATWAGRALPSEAQWTLAARAGEPTPSWAPPTTAEGAPAANTWQGYFPLEHRADDGHAGRAPVGSYPADARGLFDMIGNVWEWTRSPYLPSHTPRDLSPDATRSRRDDWDPRQPDVAVGVVKGGSYLCSPVACRRYRAAARHAQDLTMGTNHIGFRTVLEPPANR